MSDTWNGRKILMESDDWVLVPPRHQHITHLKSLPIHTPCSSGCVLGNKEGHHKPECGVCQAPVPNEVEAAYILHNWEVRERK